MISIETLQRHPIEEPEEKTRQLTRDEFEKLTSEKIQEVVKYINARFRFGPHYGVGLISIIGGEENIRSYDHENDTMLEINAGEAQEVVFDVMKEFGLDKADVKQARLETPYIENALTEVQYYPSNKVRGLVFIRERSYYADNGQTFGVSWNAQPKVSPIKFPPF